MSKKLRVGDYFALELGKGDYQLALEYGADLSRLYE